MILSISSGDAPAPAPVPEKARQGALVAEIDRIIEAHPEMDEETRLILEWAKNNAEIHKRA